MTDQRQQFAAAPKVVKPKKKYKENQPEEPQEDQIKLIYNNLMWDKRVVRGNTYSALVTTSKNVDIPYANTSSNNMQMIQRQDPQQYQQSSNRRANIQIFTDQFVETLTDKPPRYQYGAQTDFKIQKKVVRHSLPDKIGTDIQTQIWDDELFDFDYQVEPLLSVLCARTLQISRMQVLQEEQLTIMKNRQLELHLEEGQEQKKIEEMYNKQSQLQKQNAKRLENFRKQRKKKVNTHQKLFSRVLGKQYLRDLCRNTLNYVEGQGYFRNPIQSQLIDKVLPNFYTASLQEQFNSQNHKKEALQIIDAARQLVLKEHRWSKQVERTRRQKIIEKRDQCAREKAERKLMLAEEKYMKNLQAEEIKIKLQKQQEQRRLAQEEGGQVA